MGKIVVAYDGSENAQAALSFALETAKVFQDEVLLVHVQPRLDTVHTRRFFKQEDIRNYEEGLAKQAVQSALEPLESSKVPHRIIKRYGNAKEEIVQVAKEESARMIVIGTRGYGPVAGKVIGSVSYGVLHLADCPVVVVP